MSRKSNLRCIVEGCDFRVGLNRRPVFAFPRSDETSGLWKRSVGIHPEVDVRPNDGVCSEHFEEAFLVRDEDDSRNVLLMPGAVPDLMTKASREGGPGHCRMCGSARKTSLNNKLSVLRRDMEMLPMLDICLDLSGPANPLLPDGVCEACTSMVRFFTRFAKTCWNAQDVLIEKYAPGKGYKFEPCKRLADFIEEATEENYPLVEVIPDPEPPKPAPAYEDHSESEMIELIPFEEVKQELQLEISAPESPEKPPIEPAEQTPQKQPRKPSKQSAKKSTEPSPAAKRSRPSEVAPKAANEPNDLYKCDFCTHRFAIKKDLDCHIRTHIRSLHEAERKRLLQVEQFRCLRCRAQFQQAEQLKAHFAAQHQNKILCGDCKLTFNYDSQLEKHNAQVHPERVTKKIRKPKNGSNAAGGT